MGYLYRPKLRNGQLGRVWHAQYFVSSRRVRESTRTTKKSEAERFLKAREGRAAEGTPIPPRLDLVRYDELADDLRKHYKTTGERNVKEAEKRLTPLQAFFGGRRAAAIASADLTAYVEKRQTAGLANGTINRELAMLGRVLRFAMAQDPPKLLRVPAIRLLKEAPPRAGFFEHERYEAVRRRLRPDLQVAVDLAYTFGWRVRALERALGRIIPFVFPHFTDGPIHPTTGQRRYAKGDRIRDFRKAWKTACKKAGAPGMLLHDFRRTAVRNMVNDGTPEKVAMLITGHKTRSVFDRYHIVAPEDLRVAAARIAARAGAHSHTYSHTQADPAEMVSRNL